MRESIGGGWLMSIVVLFIVLFSGYLAISVNYSKAFKVKNYILSVIEQREGYTTSNLTSSELATMGNLNSNINVKQSAQTEIYKYLKDVGYFSDVIDSNYCEDNDLGEYIEGGFCLKRICTKNGNYGTGNYYKATTFLRIEFPVIDFVFKVPISGETKVIYYDAGGIECDGGI